MRTSLYIVGLMIDFIPSMAPVPYVRVPCHASELLSSPSLPGSRQAVTTGAARPPWPVTAISIAGSDEPPSALLLRDWTPERTDGHSMRLPCRVPLSPPCRAGRYDPNHQAGAMTKEGC